MKLIRGVRAFSGSGRSGAALALGSFDGVHRGHRELIRTMVAWSRENRVPSAVLTFDPHPLRFLRPREAPCLLTDTNRKVELLEELGVDFAVIQPFDHRFAALSPREFVSRIVRGQLRAGRVFVGHDYRFGCGARGETRTLRELAGEIGIGVEVLPPVFHRGEVVSSTRIRSLIRQGRIREAGDFMGHSFLVAGRIVSGDGRGRRMGYPTANMVWPEEIVKPQNGVYAVRVELGGDLREGVANIGLRPTFSTGNCGPGGVSLEVHIFDFCGSIYGRFVRISLLQQIRRERVFSDPQKLISQIKRDISRAREIL